jgi:hypothetical protein
MKTLLLQMIEIPKKVGNKGKIPVNSFFNSSFPESFLALPFPLLSQPSFFVSKRPQPASNWLLILQQN